MDRRHWFKASAGAGSLAVIPIIGFRSRRTGPHLFVVKPTACMCCEGWADQLRSEGFTVTITELDELSTVKDRLRVPSDLRACHTGLVEGYVIEGHVPAAHIKKLLQQTPQVIGLALPETAPAKVLAFGEKGRTEFTV